MTPQDENWRALIEYAHSNGGYTGRAPFPSDDDAAAEAEKLEAAFGEMNIAGDANGGAEEQGLGFIITRPFYVPGPPIQ